MVTGGFGIKYIGFAERKLFRLETRRILVQQIAEVSGGLVRCGDGEEHQP
jgi:hypothetical protein